MEGGGGLLVVMGERIRWPSELADLLPGAFTEPLDRADGRGGRLGYLDYDHPVFEIFRGPRTGDFTGARFFRSRDLLMADSETSRVLAKYDDGSVALAERKVGEGRVLVWTSTLDAFWNDLAHQPVFLPFVHQLVRYVSGRSETVASFTAGQVVDVTDATAMATAGLGEVAKALAGEEERVAFTPSGESRPSAHRGRAPTSFGWRSKAFMKSGLPGHRTCGPLAVAVNVDLAEAESESTGRGGDGGLPGFPTSGRGVSSYGRDPGGSSSVRRSGAPPISLALPPLDGIRVVGFGDLRLQSDFPGCWEERVPCRIVSPQGKFAFCPSFAACGPGGASAWPCGVLSIVLGAGFLAFLLSAYGLEAARFSPAAVTGLRVVTWGIVLLLTYLLPHQTPLPAGLRRSGGPLPGGA